MIDSLESGSLNQNSSTLLDQLLEEGGIVALLRQRIANLEEFRERYIELSAASLNVSSEAGCLTQENQIQQSADSSDNSKINKETQSLIDSLQNEVAQMSEVAFTAMRSNADLGGVIYLLTKSFECTSTKQLADLVSETLSNHNLNGTISFQFNGKREFYTSHGQPLSQNDHNIIENLSTLQILTETEQYLGFYTPYFQLLIKQFNNSELKAYSDLKDMLQMMSTGMNASTRRIISESIAAKERANLERLVTSTQKNLQNIDAKQSKDSTQVTQLANEAITNLKNQLNRYSLDNEQKNSLTNLVGQEISKIEKIIKNSSYIDASFKKVINALTASLNKQKT